MSLQEPARIQVRIETTRSWYSDKQHWCFDVEAALVTIGASGIQAYRVAQGSQYEGSLIWAQDCSMVNATAMSIKIVDEDHSRVVQDELFRQGYVWASYGSRARTFHSTKDMTYITTDIRGCIRMARRPNDVAPNTPEFVIQEVKAYEFKPVEMVTIEGKQYPKHLVIEALKHIAIDL